ncbi:hypothetical protein MN608_11321 [Microdochium nivale]|nr:hypothetical protein MN608_11321 [Microdochium nivale]
MVSHATVRASNAAIVTSRRRPLVAVFFAGATGIGHYTLRELCRATADTPGAGGLRAYIVARKADVARDVIAECSAIIRAGVSRVAVVDDDQGSGSKAGPTAEFVFVKTDDLSLINEVDRVCAVVTELEETRAAKNGGIDLARIDYVLFTQGCAVYQPRKDTKEGLDFTMALLYYSRMRATMQLMPLLLAASSSSKSKTSDNDDEGHQEQRHHATVVSIFAAGMEDKLDESNLALDAPASAYTYNNARSHMAYMHTLFFEHLALQHCQASEGGHDNANNPGSQQSSPPLLTFAHVFPGLVNGPGFKNEDLPAWFRGVWDWVVAPLFGWLVFTKPEVCGANILSIADGSRLAPAGAAADASRSSGDDVVMGTTGVAGGGTYALGSSVDDVFKPAKYRGMDRAAMRESVWKHTIGAFHTIASGQVYNGADT